MESKWLLSPGRRLTEAEKSLVWIKPPTHIESQAERRICDEVKRNWHRGEMKIATILLEGDAGSGKTQLAKALSCDFGLPYTKVTCFADMDKSDILGSILPVLQEESHLTNEVRYQYYPSEIVRAYENGWLLEIQEPTVIRDAAVLMALNSALEPDGSINLPTRIVRRHQDFIAVITANRGYLGCRPLNEALRDRVQHAEKMDLPSKAVMMDRALKKTGLQDEKLLSLMADVIILLDETARANAIKGVAGMRSYFFWADAVLMGARPTDSMYHKVIYKITTDPDEISILEQALKAKGLPERLDQTVMQKQESKNPDEMEIHITEDGQFTSHKEIPSDASAVRLKKSADSEGHSQQSSDSTESMSRRDSGEDGMPVYHELEPCSPSDQQKQDLRKKLNREARQSIVLSCHRQVKLIVHRPHAAGENKADYLRMAADLMPVIRELILKASPLLEHETATDFLKSQFYGTSFCAGKVASQDFRYFERMRLPEENPALAVALRIDESASMTAYGRLEAAKQAAVALYEFCKGCGIPVLIYGDTADSSRLEQMSIYAYVDFESKDPEEKYSLMNIQGRSNNRDGMALRIIADRLLKVPQKTKLIISISDGQPKAMPDYTGEPAVKDMQETLQFYRRKGILFLAAAIGQDKEIISEIYGNENTLDITDLKLLSVRLIQIIARLL